MGELVLIPREYEGTLIHQRPSDGYWNASQMAKANGKLWGHYWENKATQEFVAELSSNIGIPIEDLVASKVGGDHSGTWVHRRVALDLARWCCPKFAVLVNGWAATP